MGFLDKFLGGEKAQNPPRQQPAPNVVLLNGGLRVQVVGESHYQEGFESICGPKCEDGYDLEVTAHLVPEPSNPYDPNAVAVHVDAIQVGYLSRDAAVAFQPVAQELLARGVVGACRASIRGGWKRKRDGDTGHFGISLDLAGPDKAIPG